MKTNKLIKLSTKFFYGKRPNLSHWKIICTVNSENYELNKYQKWSDRLGCECEIRRLTNENPNLYCE